MAYSYAITTATGLTSLVSVPFSFLDRTHVHVALNGVQVDDGTITWITNGQLQLASTPAAGTQVKAYRATPAQPPEVHFSLGDLDPNDLNVQTLQALYVAQEAIDNLDFTLRMSADGTVFNAGGLPIDNIAQGTSPGSAVNVQQMENAIAGLGGGITLRSRLQANRTYYVSPTGNDAFFGTSPLFPFKTIQKAVDTAYSLDWNGFLVDIQLADGTYNVGANISGPIVGLSTMDGALRIHGNPANTDAVKIITTNASCFNVQNKAQVLINDLYMSTITDGWCVLATQHAMVDITNVNFGPCADAHMEAANWGYIRVTGNYKISGGAVGHVHCPQGGMIWLNGAHADITNNPAFGVFFVGVAGPGECHAMGYTWTGSATGPRFLVHSAGTIFIDTTGNLNFFPGNSPGTCDDATFGVYDYQPQKTFPTLGGLNRFLDRMGVNGAVANSPFQVDTSADQGIRFVDSTGGSEITAVNHAQSAFKILHQRGTELRGYIGSSSTPAYQITVNGVAFNGASPASPFQVATAADDTIRFTDFLGTGTEITAVNQAQNGFKILSFRGNEVRAYAAGNGTPTFHVNSTGLGFFSAAPIAKPTVSGSLGGNAALASLLTALASYGLITNSTTA